MPPRGDDMSTQDILRTLEYLHPDQKAVFEVRVIGAALKKCNLWEGAAYGKGVVTGYFDDKIKAAKLIEQIDLVAKPKAIYVALNSPNPALLARAYNRFKVLFTVTSDKDIVKLVHLLIDADPLRVAEVSSTKNEKVQAFGFRDRIKEHLGNLGWPEPLVGDSANGGHLVYAINLPNDAESVALIKGVLGALAAKFDTNTVQVDTKVFNPSRITKVYGTVARKGDSTDDRPHRRARIISLPSERIVVTSEQLEAVAALIKSGEAVEATHSQTIQEYRGGGAKLDVKVYLEKHGREVLKEKAHGESTLFVLKECVFDPSHTSGESAIGQCADGKLFYQCFHNSCKGKTWQDARLIISGNDRIMGSRTQDSTPSGQQKTGKAEPNPGFLGSIDIADYVASKFVDTDPRDLEWTFTLSLVAGTMGYLVGPAGAGKSGLEMQLAVSVATGRALFGDNLTPGLTGKVLILAAEEDVRLVHIRLKRLFDRLFPATHWDDDGQFELNAKLDPAAELFRQNIIVIPCAGKDLRLVQSHPGGDVTASQHFRELLALAMSIEGLALVFIDPLSRFYGADENNNTVATFFSTLLETIAQMTGASTICVHHVGKRAGRSEGKFSLDECMSPDVIRGASGLTGAARWQMNLFPLPPKEAVKLLGVAEAGPGDYLVCGVVKNNYAKLTEHFFLKREKGGVLVPIEALTKEGIAPDVYERITEKIIEVVKQREITGQPPMTMKFLGDFCPGQWKKTDIPEATKSNVLTAASMAVQDEKLFLVSRMAKNNRSAIYLASAPDRSQDTGQTAPSDEVCTGQLTGRGTPDSTGQNGLSGDKVVERQNVKSPDRKSPDRNGCPAPEPAPMLTPGTGQLSPLKGEEGPSLDGLLPAGLPLNGQPCERVAANETVL